MGSTDDRTCWFNVRSTNGLGPAASQRLAIRLAELQRSVTSLRDQSPAELQELGLSASLANSLADQLANPVDLPTAPGGARLLLPSDDSFPLRRFLTARPPMPPALWALGDLSLLSLEAPTIGIAGSRDASEFVTDLIFDLARNASTNGWLVVSGLARGVDDAAHRGGMAGGTGTVGIMASGILTFDTHVVLEEADPIAFISEFDPDAPWSGRRAMQRNSTIAAFSDRVVVAAAGRSGGSWEMAQLCIKRQKELFVLDLPGSEAEGNQRLIRSGATPLPIDDLDACLYTQAGPMTLFD